MNMKSIKLKVFLTASLILSGLIYAQPGKGHFKSEKSADLLLNEIPDLTEEQKESIQNLHNEFAAAMLALRDNDDLTKAEKRSQFDALHDEFRQTLESTLTDAQMDVVNDWFESRHEMGRKNQRKHFGIRPDKSNDEMHKAMVEKRIAFDDELSSAEKSTIDQMRTYMESQRELMHENGDDLTFAEKRALFKQHFEAMEPLFEIVDNHEAQLKKIDEDLREIMEANKPANLPALEKQKRYPKHEMDPRHNHMIHFLLLDTNNTSFSNEQENGAGFTIFPNPVEEVFTVRFDLVTEGVVSIELLNKQGELLEVLDSIVRTAGEQTFKVNAGGLTPQCVLC